MKRLKKLIKLRKQNDIVKILLLFFTASFLFLSYALYNAFLLHTALQNSVEYILAGDSEKIASIQEILDSDNENRINAASFQQEIDLTVKRQDASATFTAFGLSGEYIKSVYKIAQSGATKKIYMNQKAYDNLCRQLNITGTNEENNKATGARVSYSIVSLSEQPQEAEEKGTAEIMLVEENIEKEEPFAFYMFNGPYNAECKIRVDIRNKSFSQINENDFEMPGFTIENAAQLEKMQFEQEIISLRIKYSFTIAFICLGCVIALKKSLARTD